MADLQYKTFSYRFENKGFIARYVNDALPPGSYQNLNSIESRLENCLSSRLGVQALTTDLTSNFPLASQVQSLSRMKGLDNPFRYAADSSGFLYRRQGDTQGAFTQIASGLSGERLSMMCYRPQGNSNPYQFVADNNQLLKDNGTQTQTWGVQPPRTPALIQVGAPKINIIEDFVSPTLVFVNATAGPGGAPFDFKTTKTILKGLRQVTVPSAAVQSFSRTAGIATITIAAGAIEVAAGARVSVSDMQTPSFDVSAALVLTGGSLTFTFTNPGPNVGTTAATQGVVSIVPSIIAGMILQVDDLTNGVNEIIQVVSVQDDGFTAGFVNNYIGTTQFTAVNQSAVIAANKTATVTENGTIDLSQFPDGTPSGNDDYIQILLNLSNPLAVTEIRMMFDVSDKSFTQDYYYASIVPAGYQPAVNGGITTPDAQTQRVFQRAAGGVAVQGQGADGGLLPSDLPDISQLQPTELNTGANTWTVVRIRLADFLTVGLAGQKNTDWSDVVAWRIQIQTSPNQGATVGYSSIALIGGSELDSTVGQPYDYRYTFYNINTGDEWNPSVEMISANFLNVQRQPIAVTMEMPTNPQVTHWKLYRRGGTITNTWFLVDTIPISTPLPYEDVISDAKTEDNDEIVLDNDAPVISVMRTALNQPIQGITAGELWEPGTIYNVGDEVQDSNGNLQVLTNILLSAITQVQIAGNVLSLTTNKNFSVFVVLGLIGQLLSLQNFVGAAFLNGQTFIITGITTGPNGVITANIFGHAPYGPTADSGSGYLLTGSGTSGSSTPVWSTVLGGLTPDAGLLWTEDGVIPAFSGNGLATVQIPSTTQVFANQLVTIGIGNDQEEAYVRAVGNGQFSVYLQNTHELNEIVSATTRPLPGLNLLAIVFDQAWLAGDPDNPHVLYYSRTFSPENFPQENFIEVGTPDAPIMALVESRGQLYVFTTKTVWQIYAGGGATPQPVPTGVKHGLVSQFAWCASENVIYYLSYDGVYMFSGGSSQYMTEPVEWIFTGKNLGPYPAMDISQSGKAQVYMAYCNREVFVSYVDQSGNRHRMIYHEIYRRWRPDDRSNLAPLTAAFFEQDTGSFVVGDSSGMIYIDRVLDYDSGGYLAGVEIKNAISFILQTPQMDQGAEKAFKQYNELTLDMNTNGQNVDIQIEFDDATVIDLGTFNTPSRQQIQIILNDGDGYQGLNIGVIISGQNSAFQQVVLNEVHIRALVQAEFRRSSDSWWMKWGTDEFKIVKQGWFEYQSNADINFGCFIEGDDIPSYTFTLPNSNGIRKTERVRFPALKATMWRYVSTSSADYQLYDESHIEEKIVGGPKGYEKQKLSQTQ